GGEPQPAFITGPEEFARLWGQLVLQLPQKAPPPVDFKDHFVLVLVRLDGFDLAAGGLAVAGQGEAKVQRAVGVPLGGFMGNVYYSTTIAVFPRDRIKSVEGKKLPAAHK
ncbi:MAG TPA: hypothetical protein VKD72_39250, partial [Gemmataceae bacterium]|nr:hypothetical protein [Gemmataceae bacterium]